MLEYFEEVLELAEDGALILYSYSYLVKFYETTL
jgi:hypothetical protein